MDQQLKERLIGVTALVLVAIVFIPMFFKKSTDLALREKENVEFINENESEFISKLKPMTETAAIEDNNTQITAVEEPTQITAVEEPTQITAVEEQVNKDKVSSKTVEMGQMNWIVQIGSFSSKENAEKLNKKVKKAGFRSFVNPITIDDKTMHQVCLGPEYDMTAANELLKEIKDWIDKNKMNLTGIVKKYP